MTNAQKKEIRRALKLNDDLRVRLSGTFIYHSIMEYVENNKQVFLPQNMQVVPDVLSDDFDVYENKLSKIVKSVM